MVVPWAQQQHGGARAARCRARAAQAGQRAVCVYNSTHTRGAHTVVVRLIGGPNSLGGQSRERGGNFFPYGHMGQIPKRRI